MKCCLIEIYCKCMDTMQRNAVLPKLDVGSHFLFRSIFRPLLDSTAYMRVCAHCANAHCITTDTQVFVYNFISHVFCSLCFFHSLSLSLPHSLFNFTPPRDMFVFAVLYVHIHTLRGKKRVATTSISAARISYCAHRRTDCETNIMIFVEHS